jgi:hypothetical protein
MAAGSDGRTNGRGGKRLRERALSSRMGGPPKPEPASPANASKRGLFARLYASYQTPIMVNVRLPKENPLRGNAGNPGAWEGPGSGSGRKKSKSPVWPLRRPHRPAIHPGEILADELNELQVTPTELSRQIAVPANRISQIIQGKRAITGDTASDTGFRPAPNSGLTCSPPMICASRTSRSGERWQRFRQDLHGTAPAHKANRPPAFRQTGDSMSSGVMGARRLTLWTSYLDLSSAAAGRSAASGAVGAAP